jgi:uroporphyrinogen-III synthase
VPAAQVIVTRPAREAAIWVQALRQHGFDAQALPLINIQSLPHQPELLAAWSHIERYHAVMFVSANAVTGFFEAFEMTQSVATKKIVFLKRCWATGPGTTRALLQARVPAAQIDAPATDAPTLDSEALWQRVHSQIQGGERVLIVRGTDAQHSAAVGVGRDWLTQRLLAAGAEVETVVSYERRCPVWSEAQSAQVRAALPRSVWVLSSSEAIQNLQSLLPEQSLGLARAVATHPRIAQIAEKAGFGVVITSHPAIDEVTRSIKSLT